MPLAELLIGTVAPAISKLVLKLWAGDHKLALESGTSTIDILSKLIPDQLARNEADRQLAAIGEKAAGTLRFTFETEGKAIFIDDQERVAKLVAETLDHGKITADLLVRKDLDPAKLADHFVFEATAELEGLPAPRVDLFKRVIYEACQSIVDIAHELPNFTERTLGELLRQNRVLLDAANRTLDGLERIRSQVISDQETESARFETEYRRAVGRNLNKMEIFGVELSPSSRSHPLNVAYVSLEVEGLAKPTEGKTPQPEDEDSITHSVEEALATNRRILIKGSAGAGKTTLVRWIAVQAASRAFEDPLSEWNEALPFVIRLREFGRSTFPSPEAFPSLVAPSIAGTMPLGWVHDRLKTGNAVVMVDGVDEVADSRRAEVRSWIKDLTSTFPRMRLIVTSRPHAVDEGWLESDGFGEADLQPMDTAAIEKFIDHWHEAIATEVNQDQELAGLKLLADHLKESLRGNRAVRRLATSPLLCGVICALHRDTNQQLPEDRIELYERCCMMLLERRDPESGLSLTGYPRLSYRQKRSLLDDLAYWMVKNEWAEISSELAIERFEKGLQNLRTDVKPGPVVTSKTVLAFFLERSGMLNQPADNRLDFAHKTFQEFMAAQAAVNEGDLGVLAANATNSQWREVIVLGAGLARPAERSNLIKSLLAKGDQDNGHQHQLYLLAAACLDTAIGIDPDVKKEVELRVEKLLPPSSMAEATVLAESAGDVAVPFLRPPHQAYGLYASQAAASVRALGLVGSLEALQAIAEWTRDGRSTVVREIIRASDRFDPNLFSQLVVGRLDASKLTAVVLGDAFLRFGAKGLKNLGNVLAVRARSSRLTDLTPLCALHGVKELDLAGANVSDLSPLSNLVNLEHLILMYTQVRDPSPLQGLTKLYYLDLDSTKVTDLSSLRTLKHLRILDVRRTQLQDISPLAELKLLESLYLSETLVRDISPLAQLGKLSQLDLSSTKVTELSPLRRLSNLSLLLLRNTEVSNLSPIEDLANLQTLGLSDSPIISDVSPLRGLKRLRELALDRTAVADISPLSDLPTLIKLGLSNTQISAVSPLRKLSFLRELDISGTKISDISPLAGLTCLTFLDLSKTAVTDLSPLRGLMHLDKVAFRGVSAEQQKEFKEVLPQAEILRH